jgi:hypothetical protein
MNLKEKPIETLISWLPDMSIFSGIIMVSAGLYMIYTPLALIMPGLFFIYLGWPNGKKVT